MIQVDSNTIGSTMPISAWVTAIELAFVDTATGKIDVPQRVHIDRGANTLLLMPCFSEDYFSTKLVSVFPENLKRNEPVIYGSVVLNDGHTGKPLAVLDGSKLTAMRTAAVGSVGIKYLAPANADTLGIIGLGIQGFHQALFACQQRSIKQLRIHDRTEQIMLRFQERFNAFYPDIEVIPCKRVLNLCKASEIIITATGSHKPVIPSATACWKDKTIIGIGSYKPEMREIPDAVFKEVNQVFVDTLHGLNEAGDLLEPLKKNFIQEEQVFPITELIQNTMQPEEGTRFFKSVGMAAFDLYGAILVYENLS